MVEALRKVAGDAVAKRVVYKAERAHPGDRENLGRWNFRTPACAGDGLQGRMRMSSR